MDNGIGVIRPVWEAFLLRLWQNVHEVFMNGVHLEDENLVPESELSRNRTPVAISSQATSIAWLLWHPGGIV